MNTEVDMPLLLLPATAPRGVALRVLLPWFAPLVVLEPPSLAADELPGPLEEAGLVERIRPQYGAEEHGGPKAQRLAALLRQWEAWARQGKDSGELEAVKAGVQPPPPMETVRGLMHEIKDFGGPAVAGKPSHPEVAADLFLHLSHIQDQQAADMEGMLDKVASGQQALDRSMGLAEADYQPADYEQIFTDRLPPVDYSLGDEHHLPRRLQAWATLAQEATDAPQWLATGDLAAAGLLLERANRRFAGPVDSLRSPAGAAMPIPGPQLAPTPDSPQAQEAARLVLPDLSGLSQEELAGLAGSLDAGGLAEVRSQMAGLLERLATEPWSADLQEELANTAKELAAKAQELLSGAGVSGKGERGISILAFPGLSRAQVLDLMQTKQPQGLPKAKNWPQDWPVGSCPLLAVW